MLTTLRRPPEAVDREDMILTLNKATMRQTFRRVNPYKLGLDAIPSQALKACADQPARVFSNIFNISLTNATIPKSSKPPLLFLSQRLQQSPASMIIAL